MAEQQVEVKPRRPVYRSYAEVLRMLVGEAERRIRTDRTVEALPKLTITLEMRQWARHVRQLKQALRLAERKLAAADARATERGTVERSWESKRQLESKPGRRQEQRLTKLRALKAEAILDTIDLTPAEAKAYFRRFEARLRKV